MLVFFGYYLENGLNNRCTFLERSRKDLSKNVWVVASIVNRFRDKRQKRQHRRLNSYRGDYTAYKHFLLIDG